MADQPIIVFAHVPTGMNSAVDPAILSSGQVAKMVNARVDQQLITTRHGSRVIATEGDETWRSLNAQGLVYYDPARGQGAQVFSEDSASLVLAAGGRKFRFEPSKKTAVVSEIGDETTEQEPKAHLIWMRQAENYLISGDGKGSTFIYDGNNARFSSGFVGEGDRESSEIPQGIRAPVYAHGRLWVVVDARRILASDSLHGQNLTNPGDLLRFTEQTYWATGQYFVPPSNMGNIIAAEVLPTRDTRTGQGEIMFHCVNGGVFSINGNIYPRETWSSTPMVNHFLLDTAATGPYAVDIQEGDQLFRSRSGIQTLRSARAESRLIGRPLKPISAEVGVWMNSDHVPYLRFASLINWSQEERLLCTTAPTVAGSHRYHKGLVSLNWDPTDSGQSNPSWDGLWTFPSSYRYITCMTRGMFSDAERAFGIHWDGERNSLVEYDPFLLEDVLEDGTRKPIQTIVETREVADVVNPFNKVSLESGDLFLRDVKRATKWEVQVRNNRDDCWTKWRSGEACVDPCIDPCSLTAQQPRDYEFALGSPPDSLLPGRRWQFRVVLEGWCRVEALVIRISKTSDDNKFSSESLNLQCKDMKVCCEADDYSYSK